LLIGIKGEGFAHLPLTGLSIVNFSCFVKGFDGFFGGGGLWLNVKDAPCGASYELTAGEKPESLESGF
jgi:hypothetical protein